MAPERYRATRSTPSQRPQGQAKRPIAQNKAPNRGQSQGRQPQKAVPRELSPAEKHRREAKREAIRRRKEELARQKQIRRERRKRLFKLSFVVALVFVVLYWTFVAVSIATRPDGSEDALSLLIFRQGERKAIDEYEPEEVCIGETKYLPISFLKDFVAISEFGDHKTRSFLLCSDGEYATFYINNEEVIINGEHVAMRAPARLIDGELHLPVDFFAEKMTCFELGKNNATYGADVLTFLPEQSQSFVFRTCTGENTVDYKTVPVAPTADPAAPTT